MDFTKALEMLKSAKNEYKVLRYKLETVLEPRSDGAIAVRLVNTDVITYMPNGDIVLDSGGWQTVTTKARYNEYLPSPWAVYQEKRIWYVCHGGWDNGKTWAFSDGMTLHPDGSVTGAASLDAIAEQKDLEKQIKSYARDFVTALFAGKVGKPSAGDCFYCVMSTSDGETLGDAMGDTEHLRSHMAENYFVPSLLYNAVEEGAVSHMAKWTIQALWDGQHEPSRIDDLMSEQIRKAVERYMRRRFGIA